MSCNDFMLVCRYPFHLFLGSVEHPEEEMAFGVHLSYKSCSGL